MSILRKELVGWTVFGRHYRYRRAPAACAVRAIDAVGNVFFRCRPHPFPADPRRICFVLLNHLGDMVVATAFTQALRQRFPQARITAVVRTAVMPIARMAPGVDEVLALDAPWFSRGDSRGWGRVFSFCMRHFRKFDAGFELYGDPRSLAVARAISKVCVGSGIRGLGFLLDINMDRGRIFGRPMPATHLDVLHASAGEHIAARPAVHIAAETIESIRRRLAGLDVEEKRFVLIHPGVSVRIREWPLQYWGKLVARLLQKMPVVTADPDRSKVTALQKMFAGRPFHSLSLSLEEYAACIRCASLVISVESLAGHFAAACNVEVIWIHSGTTIASEMGPCVEPPSVVFCDTRCPRYPCGLHTCPYGYPSPCLERIGWEDVARAAEKILGSQDKPSRR